MPIVKIRKTVLLCGILHNTKLLIQYFFVFFVLLANLFLLSCTTVTSFYTEQNQSDNPLDLSDFENLQIQHVYNLVNDLSHFNDQPLTNDLMRKIVDLYSIDKANLYLLSRIYHKDSENLKEYYRYNKIIEKLQNEEIERETIKKLRNYHIIFIPGFAYIRKPESGADFAFQRGLLNALSIKNSIVRTDEFGLVEENALTISEYFNKKDFTKPLIIVSASKGSLDFAEAVGSGMIENTESIHSWINVGGILNGSYIAEEYCTFPRSILTLTILNQNGQNMEIARNLKHTIRSKRFEDLVFPKHIRIIHFSGMLFKNNVKDYMKDQFEILKPYGPNDGISTILDSTKPGGTVILEIGLDHYLRDGLIHKKTLALALLSIEESSEIDLPDDLNSTITKDTRNTAKDKTL